MTRNKIFTFLLLFTLPNYYEKAIGIELSMSHKYELELIIK